MDMNRSDPDMGHPGAIASTFGDSEDVSFVPNCPAPVFATVSTALIDLLYQLGITQAFGTVG